MWGGAAFARCGCAVGLQAYVGGAAAHNEKQGDDYQQGYYALYLKRGAPACCQGNEREYLNVDCAAEGTRHSGYAEREVAAAVEEVHGCGAGYDSDEHGACDGAGDDVGGIEVPDCLHARDCEEAQSCDEGCDGHESAGAVAVCERADEGRDEAGCPCAGGYGVGDGAAVPSHVFEDEVLHAAEDELRRAGGGVGADCGHGEDEPAVVEGCARSPVGDGLDEGQCAGGMVVMGCWWIVM